MGSSAGSEVEAAFSKYMRKTAESFDLTKTEEVRCPDVQITLSLSTAALYLLRSANLGCVTRLWNWGRVTQPRKSRLADLCRFYHRVDLATKMSCHSV